MIIRIALSYTDIHECKDKSSVAKDIFERTTAFLSENSSTVNQIVPKEFAVVFDGMAIVRFITKKGNAIRAVNEFGKVFIKKIEEKLHETIPFSV